MFTAGQPLDVLELNKIAEYPKVMIINAIDTPGGGASAANGHIPIASYDGDLIGPSRTTGGGATFTLDPGEYFFDILGKNHQGSTGWVALHNDTLNTEVKRAYCYNAQGVGGMNDGNCKIKLTITSTTAFSIRGYASGIAAPWYAAQSHITMLRPL